MNLPEDAREILKFVEDQNRENRSLLDREMERLLRWFGGGVAALLLVFGATITWLKMDTNENIDSQVKAQIPPKVEAAIAGQLTAANIQIAVEKRIKESFQTSVDAAITKELQKPIWIDRVNEVLAKQIAANQARRNKIFALAAELRALRDPQQMRDGIERSEYFRTRWQGGLQSQFQDAVRKIRQEGGTAGANLADRLDGYVKRLDRGDGIAVQEVPAVLELGANLLR